MLLCWKHLYFIVGKYIVVIKQQKLSVGDASCDIALKGIDAFFATSTACFMMFADRSNILLSRLSIKRRRRDKYLQNMGSGVQKCLVYSKCLFCNSNWRRIHIPMVAKKRLYISWNTWKYMAFIRRWFSRQQLHYTVALEKTFPVKFTFFFLSKCITKKYL